MNILKAYYKLPQDEFKKYVDSAKGSINTLFFFEQNKTPYFLFNDDEVLMASLELEKKQWKFDSLFKSFSPFTQKQLIQSFLIEEIQATNLIEQVSSTRHDVFSIINKYKVSDDSKLKSIVNSYECLLVDGTEDVKTHEDVRKIYDRMSEGILDLDNKPDGMIYRKNSVYITNGLDIVNVGFQTEKEIEKGMEDFLSLYNNKEKSEYIALLASHFLFEEIHPFYDGNGRLGRLLLSMGLFKRTHSYFSFCISNSFQKEKSKYYRSFEKTTDVRNQGDLNAFVLPAIKILIKNIDELILMLEKNKNDQLAFEKKLTKKPTLSKTQKRILSFLHESKWNSFFGVTNQEIMENCDVSKRSLIYFLNKNKEIVDDSKFGKITYHKLIQNIDEYIESVQKRK